MKSILPLLFVLFTLSPALAEPPEEDILRPRIPTRGQFFVGFDVGLNTTWFDGNPIYRAFFPSEEESRLFRSGFGFEPFGAFYVGMRLAPGLRVRLRGDYDLRVAERSGSTLDSCPVVDANTGRIVGSVPVEVDKEYRLEIAYLTLSLVGEYRMGQTFVFLGPTWSKPMRRTFTETDRISEDESFCVYFADTPDSTRSITAEAAGLENVSSVIGVTFGVGYEIEMTTDLLLVPQIGINLPFSSALVDDEEYVFRATTGGSGETNTTRLNRHMYFRTLQASIGLRYSF